MGEYSDDEFNKESDHDPSDGGDYSDEFDEDFEEDEGQSQDDDKGEEDGDDIGATVLRPRSAMKVTISSREPSVAGSAHDQDEFEDDEFEDDDAISQSRSSQGQFSNCEEGPSEAERNWANRHDADSVQGGAGRLQSASSEGAASLASGMTHSTVDVSPVDPPYRFHAPSQRPKTSGHAEEGMRALPPPRDHFAPVASRPVAPQGVTPAIESKDQFVDHFPRPETSGTKHSSIWGQSESRASTPQVRFSQDPRPDPFVTTQDAWKSSPTLPSRKPGRSMPQRAATAEPGYRPGSNKSVMGALERYRAREKAKFQQQIKQRTEENKATMQRAMLVREVQSRRSRRRHDEVMGQPGGTIAIPDQRKTWRARETWDDRFLRRARYYDSTPEPATYSPSTKLTKKAVKAPGFGATPRFENERRMEKYRAGMPAPGQYPREQLHQPGKEKWDNVGGISTTKGGTMSMAYAEDPDHLLELNNIIRDNKQPHHCTPGPAWCEPKKIIEGYDKTNYRPSFVNQKFNQSKAKSMIEWVQYYAKQIPGAGDYELDGDLTNAKKEHVRGKLKGGVISQADTPDFIELERRRSKGKPGPIYMVDHKNLMKDIAPNRINPNRRVLFTEFAASDSVSYQLQNPHKATGRKPEPATYFETLTFQEELKQNKLAKSVVDEMGVDEHPTTSSTAQVFRNNNLKTGGSTLMRMPENA